MNIRESQDHPGSFLDAGRRYSDFNYVQDWLNGQKQRGPKTDI